MKKGFLFSIEALLSITVVITALVILNYSFISPVIDNDITLIRTQSAQATTFYYGEVAVAQDKNTSFCASLAYYNAATKAIETTKVCRGYS